MAAAAPLPSGSTPQTSGVTPAFAAPAKATVSHLKGNMYLVGGTQVTVTQLDGKAITGPLTPQQHERILSILTATFTNNQAALAALTKTNEFSIVPNITQGTASLVDKATGKPLATSGKINDIQTVFRPSDAEVKGAKATGKPVQPQSLGLKLADTLKEKSVQSMLPKTVKPQAQISEKETPEEKLKGMTKRLNELPYEIATKLTGTVLRGPTLLDAFKLQNELKQLIKDTQAQAKKMGLKPEDYVPKWVVKQCDARGEEIEVAAGKFKMPTVSTGFFTSASVKDMLGAKTQEIDAGKFGNKEEVISALKNALDGLVVQSNLLKGEAQEKAIGRAKAVHDKLEKLGISSPTMQNFNKQLEGDLKVPSLKAHIRTLSDQMNSALRKSPLTGNDFLSFIELTKDREKALEALANQTPNSERGIDGGVLSQLSSNRADANKLFKRVNELDTKIDWSASPDKISLKISNVLAKAILSTKPEDKKNAMDVLNRLTQKTSPEQLQQIVEKNSLFATIQKHYTAYGNMIIEKLDVLRL